jgi:hypothetical protein
MVKVFLAGGFHSGWQKAYRGYLKKRLGSAFDKVELFDPTEILYPIYKYDQIVSIERNVILNETDLFLGYLESNNNGGFEFSICVGWATAAQDVTVICCIPPSEIHNNRHVEYLRVAAGLDGRLVQDKYTFYEEGINMITKMLQDDINDK